MTRRLIKGLVLLEGSFPVDHLHPAAKHMIHYGPQTADAGLLDWMSMYCFERKNKDVKNKVKNGVQPLSSLANHVELQIEANLKSFSKKQKICPEEPCTLSVGSRCYTLTDREKNDLQFLGVTSFTIYRVYMVAKILGVHFRCGEWGCRRCGSVITTIYRGSTRYCILDRFVEVQGKKFASVRWLSCPIYPHLPFKLVVKVKLLTQDQQRVHRCVIAVDRIEPCTVGVIPHEDGVHFYMLRNKGYDR